MKKKFSLQIEGKNPDRVLDATKHEIRKYLKRERSRALPEGMHFWDFDCRFGATPEDAQTVHLSAVIGLVDEAAKAGQSGFYLELLAKPAARTPRDPNAEFVPRGRQDRGEQGAQTAFASQDQGD